MAVSSDIIKTKIGEYARGYINDIDSADDILKFESIADNIEEGIFKIKLNAFFNGGYTSYAPPIAYIDAKVLLHGLHKVHKITFELKPEERPVFGSIAAGTSGSAYAYVTEQIDSLIFPTTDPNSNIYEPMFFYNYDTTVLGYFIETELIVNITEENPLYFRWGSALSDRSASLSSGELVLIKMLNT